MAEEQPLTLSRDSIVVHTNATIEYFAVAGDTKIIVVGTIQQKNTTFSTARRPRTIMANTTGEGDNINTNKVVEQNTGKNVKRPDFKGFDLYIIDKEIHKTTYNTTGEFPNIEINDNELHIDNNTIEFDNNLTGGKSCMVNKKEIRVIHAIIIHIVKLPAGLLENIMHT